MQKVASFDDPLINDNEEQISTMGAFSRSGTIAPTISSGLKLDISN